MYKKAQGLSITTIIVAAIALIVLVVLVAIFTGRLGGFSEGVTKVGGDSNLNCVDINIAYNLISGDECKNREGTSLLSADSIANPNLVCCTR